MPAAQLFTSVLETSLNRLLALDENSPNKLKALTAKRLKIQLAECPWPFELVFADEVTVLIAGADSQADCSIGLSLETLPLLKDSSRLSQLIQQNKLALEGDIHLAQDVSNLFRQLDIDWEAELAKFTGEVPAHSLFRLGTRLREQLGKSAQQLVTSLSEGLIEEKQLAAHPYGVEDFCLQVAQLRSDTARLEARLQLLTDRS